MSRNSGSLRLEKNPLPERPNPPVPAMNGFIRERKGAFLFTRFATFDPATESEKAPDVATGFVESQQDLSPTL